MFKKFRFKKFTFKIVFVGDTGFCRYNSLPSGEGWGGASPSPPFGGRGGCYGGAATGGACIGLYAVFRLFLKKVLQISKRVVSLRPTCPPRFP